jgi:hypothetical protein
VNVSGPRNLIVEAARAQIIAIARSDQNRDIAQVTKRGAKKLAHVRESVLPLEEVPGDAERVHTLTPRDVDNHAKGRAYFTPPLLAMSRANSLESSLEVNVGDVEDSHSPPRIPYIKVSYSDHGWCMSFFTQTHDYRVRNIEDGTIVMKEL